MRNLLLAASVILAGCGDNSDDAAEPQAGDEAGGDEAAESPADALNGREYAGEGRSGETWIDGHVVGEGAPGTLEAQLDRSFDDFGARIDGDVLEVRLPGAHGSVFTIRRDTDESAIPGAVALDLEPSAAVVSVTTGLQDVDKGTITISDCPKAAGDTVRGSLQGVLLQSDGDASWRMDLDFQVVVTSASGELTCTTGGGGGGEGGGGEENQCPNTICEDRSFGCCPFDECLNDCEFTCTRVPCEGDEAACKHTCLRGCVDTCGLTGGCLTDIQGMWDCQLDSGCFDADAEMTEDACTRSSCCDAFSAVY